MYVHLMHITVVCGHRWFKLHKHTSTNTLLASVAISVSPASKFVQHWDTSAIQFELGGPFRYPEMPRENFAAIRSLIRHINDGILSLFLERGAWYAKPKAESRYISVFHNLNWQRCSGSVHLLRHEGRTVHVTLEQTCVHQRKHHYCIPFVAKIRHSMLAELATGERNKLCRLCLQVKRGQHVENLTCMMQ